MAKQPFVNRIVFAFVLMTALVSGIFSLSIVAIVHLIEEHLVSEELHRELNSVLQEDIKAGKPPRLDSHTRFYASDMPEYAIPDEFSGLADGFTEIVDAEKAFYAYTLEINSQHYMLVQAQDEFEAREQALFDVVLAGFILTVMGAWGLGWLMARKVMVPVTRLAQQVRHRDQLDPVTAPLAPDYPNDEVGQLAAAFDSTLGQLRQSLERERLFTGDVSHELRTPLMAIATSAELLEQTSLTPHQEEQVQRIGRASERMRDLVQIFLQLARNKPDDSQLTGSSTLLQVANEQAAHWGPLFHKKKLDFQIRVEGENSNLYNPALLGTVMANLLRNALHYTEQGYAHLVLERDGFRIEDSGEGIPPDLREKIFQPFVRGRQARGEGLGLGLSLVKRICSHQRWHIFVHELKPHGSCFKVAVGGKGGLSNEIR